ncbi:MAG: HAD family phosphatase [Muribaculaceae bacterium]|nr:HAD family phosphatase [Muribaculaceae bacterium]
MNLLFDLGGVIMDIRKENCVAAFERLGLKNADKYFGEFSQQGPFMFLERGDITIDQFHEALRKELPAGTTDDRIDDAFCQFLIGIPVHRLHSLEQLRRRYPVYLLSNTNPIMWDSKIKTEFQKDGREREDYFDGMITSFEAKSLKPDRQIFQYAAEKLGIQPSETLFLDDSQTNLEAAEELGFKTALVEPGTEFPEILAEVLPRLNS